MSRVTEIIKKAEKHISAGDLDRAKSLLEDAQRTEPNNEYINAILERVVLLGTRDDSAPAQELQALQEAAVLPTAAAPPEDDVQHQVKQLTVMAHDLFERGSYDSAFDSLMKAFMLDPLSKDVAREETVIVPAFELMKKRGTLAPVSDESRPTTAQLLQRGLANGGPGSGSSGQLSRLEQLKLQKEQERSAREREMWRKASGTPRISEIEEDAATAAEGEFVPPSPQKTKDGIFSRLRGGLHLG